MEERVRLLGGTLTVNSSPVQRTRVHARLAMETTHADDETAHSAELTISTTVELVHYAIRHGLVSVERAPQFSRYRRGRSEVPADAHR
jgi:hypothetical protein